MRRQDERPGYPTVRGVERRRRGPFVEFRGEGDSGERKRTSGIHGGGGGASVRARATGATAGCRARAGRWRGGARPRGHRPSRRRTRRHRLQQRLLAAAGVRQRAGVVHAPVGRRRCLRVQTLQASQQRADLALHQVQLGPCQRPPPCELGVVGHAHVPQNLRQRAHLLVQHDVAVQPLAAQRTPHLPRQEGVLFNPSPPHPGESVLRMGADAVAACVCVCVYV